MNARRGFSTWHPIFCIGVFWLLVESMSWQVLPLPGIAVEASAEWSLFGLGPRVTTSAAMLGFILFVAGLGVKETSSERCCDGHSCCRLGFSRVSSCRARS